LCMAFMRDRTELLIMRHSKKLEFGIFTVSPKAGRIEKQFYHY
jgi:hypothetical protein